VFVDDMSKYGVHEYYGLQIGIAFTAIWGMLVLFFFTGKYLPYYVSKR
jgi:hypothetical protein